MSLIQPADLSNEGFSDVQAGAWYMPYIKTAKQLGVFSGDGGANTARPDATINRAEALKLTFETLRVSKGYTVSSCSFSYGDVQAGAWYYNYACQAKNYDLFGGGSFLNPGALSSRGEVAQMLYDLDQAGLF